jgi:hypothetical protein
MKRFTNPFTAAALGATLALLAINSHFISDAWAQIRPRSPIFGADTQVTNLRVIDTATVETLVVGTGCTNCGGDPGGTTGQVQYNNAGAFGGISEGSAGQVLTSNGAMMAPSFQAAGGSGTSVYGGYMFDDNMGGQMLTAPSGWTLTYNGAGTWTLQTDLPAGSGTSTLWGTFNTEIPGTCVTVDTMGGTDGMDNLNVTTVVDDCAGTPADSSGVYFSIYSIAVY